MTVPLYALMPCKNEENRYLKSCLEWLMPMVDGVSFYDDRSTDNSPVIAQELGCKVTIRHADDPSFLTHEGRFRQNAWRAFEHELQPVEGSWVLAIDADEYLVDIDGRQAGGPGDVLGTLRGCVQFANSSGAEGVVLPIPEVFTWAGGVPMVRKDGYWGTIRGPRLFKYRKGGTFNPKPMGCGSEPTYLQEAAGRGAVSIDSYGLNLLHFGYAHPDDLNAKFSRYSGLLEHGHDNSHVLSIPQPAKLEQWGGMIPKVKRGTQVYY